MLCHGAKVLCNPDGVLSRTHSILLEPSCLASCPARRKLNPVNDSSWGLVKFAEFATLSSIGIKQLSGKVMAIQHKFTGLGGVVAALVLANAFAVTPAAAQDDSCVCIVAPGTAGQVTAASGWVKLNGDTGLVDATENAPLSVGSVLRTGPAGSAAASVGAGCNVAVAALSELSISTLDDGRMCVRLTEVTPVAVAPGGSGATAVVAAGGAALLGGGLVMLGLGQDDPVSQ